MKENGNVLFKHKLRTSLNHIIGYCEILQEDVSDMGQEHLLTQLKVMSSEAEKASALITSFFSSIQNFPKIDSKSIKNRTVQSIDRILELVKEVKLIIAEKNMANLTSDVEKIASSSNKMLILLEEAFNWIGRGGAVTETLPEKGIVEECFDQEKKLDDTILIIDDDEMNRDVISRHLIKQGYRIFEAANGFEGIEMLGKISCNLIILDIIMPDINGYEVLKILKSEKKSMDIPVIVISALGEVDSAIKCIEMGAEDYLPKSFDPVLLRARIGACLERKRLRDKELEYMTALLKSQAALAGELSEAAEYVRSLLPPPLEGEIRSYWRFLPSTQLGGDCFGYHWLNNDELAIYLLDVSGHGVGAALLSISVMSMLRTESLQTTDFGNPERVLETLNETFPMEKQNNMYFSIWYGIYNRKTRTVTYSNAGAPPAILINYDNDISVKELTTSDMIIGIESGTKYKAMSMNVCPGDRIFLFSDGVYEIKKVEEKMMEFRDFVKILARRPEADKFLIDSVLDHVRNISVSKSFEDDVSLLEFIL